MPTCPACRYPLSAPGPRCEHCGLPLTGPAAAELWQVDQQIGALVSRREALLAQLRQPAPAQSVPPSGAAAAPATVVPARSPWTAQRLLLGLGVLLVVVAGLVFVAVSWSRLGIAGQVAAVTVGAAASGVVSRVLERRLLPASAEAAAALSSGLLVVGLVAAHELGLAGLGATDGVSYAAVCALVVAVVGTAASVGSSLRTWSTVGVVAAAAAPLLGVAAADADPLPATLAFAAAAGAFWAVRSLPGALARFRRPARVVALCYLAPTWGVPLLAAWADEAQSLGCTGVALGAAAAVLVWCGRPGPDDGARWARHQPLIAFAVLAAAAEIAAGSSTLPVPAAAGVVVGAAVVTAALGGPARASASRWSEIVAGVAAGTVAAGSLLLLPRLEVTAARADGWLGRIVADAAWLPAVLAWSAGAAAAAVVAARQARPRTLASGYAASSAVVAVALVAATREPSVLAAALLAAAAVVAACGFRSAAAEAVLAGIAATTALAAFAVALEDPTSLTPVALVLGTSGVLSLAYGFRPGRAWLWWVGAALGAGGVWTLLLDDAVRTVEAYTLPLAALFLLAGGLGRLRRVVPSGVSSWVVTGPALAVGLLPSALVSASDDTLARPLVVLAVGTAVLLVGVWRRWQAPVVVAATALVVVAVSQLAPYAVLVPRWASLGTVGALLLAVGVRYEARRRDARTAVRWVRSLH